MDKRAAEQYLDRLFGTRQGHVAVAYKDPTVPDKEAWQEHQFAWPKAKADIIKWAEIHHDANIFVCPALRKDGDARKKGNMQPTRWLWADVDWQSVPKDKVGEVHDRIGELGTLVIASGSGDNAHVYVELTQPVSHEDFIKLNTGLRDYLYADNKQADNSLLRLPGTTNWKTEVGSPVAERGGNGKKTSKTALLKRRAFRDAKVPTDDFNSEWNFVSVEGVSRRMQRKLEWSVERAVGYYRTRHDAVYAMTKDLHRAGFNLDQIHSLMAKYPAGVDKMADENGYDLHEDISRVYARILQAEADEPVIEGDESDDDFALADDESDAEEREADLNKLVASKLLQREATRRADMLEAMAGHTEPPADTSQCLSDALALPPAPVQWLIEGLCSATANVVITGQYKSGKTKLMVSSLVAALVDGTDFLGKFPVHVPEGGAVVGHWNLEMSALDLIDKYMRPVGYTNPQNVHVANWQGYRLNILTELGMQHAVEWLKSRGVQVWTIDSWSALCRMCGVDSNKGTEVSMLLGRLDEIKVQTGVQVCFFLAHTARASAESERPGTRGASEVDDHVDTRWMFVADSKSDVRWLSAEGRDTQLSPISLEYHEDTGRSTVGAMTRQAAAEHGLTQVIVQTLKDRPNGLNSSTLQKLVKEASHKGVSSIREAIKDAESNGWIRIESVPRIGGGGRPELMHYLTGDTAPADGGRTMKATPREVNLSAISVRPRRK